MDSYVGRKYIEEEMHSNCESKEIPKGRQIGPSMRHLPGANAYPMPVPMTTYLEPSDSLLSLIMSYKACCRLGTHQTPRQM